MSSKVNAATIVDLKVAYDESKNKKYRKGKFLGKVTIFTVKTHVFLFKTLVHSIYCSSALLPWINIGWICSLLWTHWYWDWQSVCRQDCTEDHAHQTPPTREGDYSAVLQCMYMCMLQHGIRYPFCILCMPLYILLCSLQMTMEIEIHRALSHPNVVGFHGFFDDQHHVYILLELCRRRSLMELHKRRKALTEPEARYYLKQILLAVKYLHEQKARKNTQSLAWILTNHSFYILISGYSQRFKTREFVPQWWSWSQGRGLRSSNQGWNRRREKAVCDIVP